MRQELQYYLYVCNYNTVKSFILMVSDFHISKKKYNLVGKLVVCDFHSNQVCNINSLTYDLVGQDIYLKKKSMKIVTPRKINIFTVLDKYLLSFFVCVGRSRLINNKTHNEEMC